MSMTAAIVARRNRQQATATPAEPTEPTVATVEKSLTLRLPAGATELVMTEKGIRRVLDASAKLFLDSFLHDSDDLGVTMHLAMKQFARVILWGLSKHPAPGWAKVPRLTRKDDAAVVLLRYGLEAMFAEAVKRSGGFVDGGAAVAGAQFVRAAEASGVRVIEGEYGELLTALAGLVSGPAIVDASQDVPQPGSAA